MRYKGDDGFNSNSSLLLSNDAAYNGLIRVHLRANNQTLDLELPRIWNMHPNLGPGPSRIKTAEFIYWAVQYFSVS